METKYIDTTKTEVAKPKNTKTVFTHILNGFGGWENTKCKPKDMKIIKWLGTCQMDGDMFSAETSSKTILIFKGTKGDEFN